jgi:hypothetical protein
MCGLSYMEKNMPSLDVFNGDAFSVQTLTAAINENPIVPGRLGMLGLFNERGITTTSMMIEKKGKTLSLVSASERGAPGDTHKRDKRQMVSFPAIHLQAEGAVLADEVQNIRAFGSETELETVQGVVNEELMDMRDKIDATLEYQRVGAIQGKVYDADGTTVLLNLFTAFGLTQQTTAMVLGTATTDIKAKVLDAMKKIENVLGATATGGYRVFCGDTFWEAFIAHDNVKAAFDRW